MNGNDCARVHIRHDLTPITMVVREGPEGPVVHSTAFGIHGAASRVVPAGLEHAVRAWTHAVCAYLDGGRVDLASIPIDLARQTPFRRAVLHAARAIPRGRAISYAELAASAGSPRGARAAASAMRHNPFALLVPCHRVIRGNGDLGGFMGKTGGAAVALKRRLLRHEDCATA
jgi:methylated-DNA-[protein]-cysteine S-methyltransferase